MRGLSAFDARLSPASPAPLAVAFSGGGDSLALLLLAKAWADAHGRRVIALTVDHGLQPASAGWTERCRETAARLGADFQALRWEGDKPARGLPAAAREARHRLLAEAAREVGARVLLMGHTADDLREGAAMRAEGSSVPDPREWSPSPAWPEGRGVFVLRPLLGAGRAELRDWLSAQGETWIDDPANEDARFARSRARDLLSSTAKRGRGTAGSVVEGAGPGSAAAAAPSTASRSSSPVQDGGGVLTLPRTGLDPAAIAAACLCAAGTLRPPRGDRLARLTERLQGPAPFTATLGGARIEADADTVRFMRDAGESARGGLAPIALQPHRPAVWDGRFEVVADRPGLTVRALKGLAAQLPADQRQRLKAVPAAARPALPATVDQSGAVSCPLLAGDPSVRARPLALERFAAAIGRVRGEPEME